MKFEKAPNALTQEVYRSTSSAEKADPEMVEAFKGMVVGEAIMISKETIGSSLPRSVKITVGKAAKEAGWKLNYKNYNGGFLAKIVAPVTADSNGNGVEAEVDASEEPTNGVAEATPEESTEAPAPTGRGRR